MKIYKVEERNDYYNLRDENYFVSEIDALGLYKAKCINAMRKYRNSLHDNEKVKSIESCMNDFENCKRNEKGKTKTLIRFFDFHELETYYSVVEIDVNDPIDTKANKDYYGFIVATNEYKNLIPELKEARESVEDARIELEKIMEFKESPVGGLIKRFIAHNSNELMEEIEREIESSGNPFEITIYKEDYDWSKGEVFGPTKKRFSIGRIRRFYYFDNWDIDDDIEGFENHLNSKLRELEKLTREKKYLEQEYGLTESDLVI